MHHANNIIQVGSIFYFWCVSRSHLERLWGSVRVQYSSSPNIAFSALSPALKLGTIKRNRLGYYAKREHISSEIKLRHVPQRRRRKSPSVAKLKTGLESEDDRNSKDPIRFCSRHFQLSVECQIKGSSVVVVVDPPQLPQSSNHHPMRRPPNRRRTCV